MGDELKDKLRRLRRDQPQAAAPPEVRAGMPGWLRARLDRKRAGQTQSPPEPPAGLCATTSGPPAELAEHTGPGGVFAARTTRFPLQYEHGSYRLDEVDQADAGCFALLTGDPALADLDARRVVYLDTETTGLSGGAGTYVYMVGLGYFEDDEFVCWQGFMREPGEERALLAETARIVDAHAGVVSFFGKSFDRHRLEDKMRLVGVAPPFAECPHLDLYHPCRRLTRGAWMDGRLATLERELCGLERVDDLPGAFAPAAWFDFLGERPHRLEGVFRHNLDDVLSLVGLTAWLGRVRAETRASGHDLAGPAPLRARALARAYADAGAREDALDWTERAREREPARDLDYARAELLRRAGRADVAHAAFEELHAARDDRHSAPALLAHAKLLEHDTKDLAAALAACRSAAPLLPLHHTGSEYARLAKDLRARVERLERKLGCGS